MRVKRTLVQKYQWAVVDAIDNKLSDIANQRSVLERCGLSQEADKLNGEIVTLNARRKRLIEQIENDRKRLAFYIPKMLLLCDKLAEISSDFATEISKVSKTNEKNSFSAVIDKNIEDTRNVMKQWEDAVVIIDEVDDQPLSNYFADISEQFNEKIGKMLDEYLDELSNNKEFKKFF